MGTVELAGSYRAAEWEYDTKQRALKILLARPDAVAADLLALARQEIGYGGMFAARGHYFAAYVQHAVASFVAERHPQLGDVSSMILASGDDPARQVLRLAFAVAARRAATEQLRQALEREADPLSMAVVMAELAARGELFQGRPGSGS